MKTQTPVVFQTLARWDNAYSSTALSLAKELSRDRKVLFVERPFTRKDVLLQPTNRQIMRRKKLWQQGTFMEQAFPELPNLYMIYPKPSWPINALPDGRLFEAMRQKQNQAIWELIDRCLIQLGIHEFVYFNSFDPVNSIIKSRLSVQKTVYHCVDHMGGEPYIARHGVKAEAECARRSDLVISTSKALHEKMGCLNPNAFLLPNAGDYHHFRRTDQAEPEEMRYFKGPKVMYTGSIGSRIDATLMYKTARLMPSAQFLFIGPVSDVAIGGTGLFDLSNVHLLGPKPYAKLPAYIAAADACLIPFVSNELTRCVYPLKINEYLAAGKPVISTPFTDLSDFEGLIQIASNPVHMVAAIRSAIEEPSPRMCATRQHFASKNTWEERAERLSLILENTVSKTQTLTFEAA